MNNPPKQQSSSDMTKYLYLDKSISKEMSVMNRALLQKLCCDRIKAHKEVENIIMTNKEGDFKDKIIDQYKKINQFRFNEDQDKIFINDKIAHFFLEMVNSDTDEHIFKYAKNEKTLLEYRIFDRMKSVNESDKAYFLDDLLINLNIDFKPLTQIEFNRLQVDLRELVYKKKNPTIQQFFKVPFQEAYGSLAGLNVILDRGQAYIYQDEIVRTVLNKYEESLIRTMTKLKNNEKFKEYQENDSQFLDMRERLKNFDFGEQIAEIQGGHKLSFVNIQQFSAISFPPCMKIMHDKLVREHHLKYLSRLQLQLFQKSTGMPVNDCVNFWRVSFSDRISDKQFEEYQYNIRHNYGLEGKRADYSSRSCMNIWNQQATPDYDGCPIKTFTDEKFQILLNTFSIHERDTIHKIMEHKNLNHYDVACKLIWDAKHPDMTVKVERSFIMNNPIIYYKSSREYYDPKGSMKQQKQ